MSKTATKRNPQDTTVRNVRASHARDEAQDMNLEELKVRLRALEDEGRLLAELERRITALEVRLAALG